MCSSGAQNTDGADSSLTARRELTQAGQGFWPPSVCSRGTRKGLPSIFQHVAFLV